MVNIAYFFRPFAAFAFVFAVDLVPVFAFVLVAFFLVATAFFAFTPFALVDFFGAFAFTILFATTPVVLRGDPSPRICSA